jgi:hypothetical protein
MNELALFAGAGGGILGGQVPEVAATAWQILTKDI